MDVETLRSLNSFPIRTLDDPLFASFGRVLHSFDAGSLIRHADLTTTIDQQANTYVASVPSFESFAVVQQIADLIFGGLPVEAGYCNGPNSTINGLEYHKSPEVFIAVTDSVQFLGLASGIGPELTYSTEMAQAWFFPAGTVVECHPLVLHFAPCKTSHEGFKSIIILPRGTNTPLEHHIPDDTKNPESRLLFMKNKWLIAHPQRTRLVEQGAWAGLTGPNTRLRID